MVDIYFKIGEYNFEQSFNNASSALAFISELDSCGLVDGGAPREHSLVGCMESGKYAINVWEKHSQRRVSKGELEKISEDSAQAST